MDVRLFTFCLLSSGFGSVDSVVLGVGARPGVGAGVEVGIGVGEGVWVGDGVTVTVVGWFVGTGVVVLAIHAEVKKVSSTVAISNRLKHIFMYFPIH